MVAAQEGLAGDGRAEQVLWGGQCLGARAGAALGDSYAGRDFCKAECPKAQALSRSWSVACPPAQHCLPGQPGVTRAVAPWPC